MKLSELPVRTVKLTDVAPTQEISEREWKKRYNKLRPAKKWTMRQILELEKRIPVTSAMTEEWKED